MTGLRGMIHLWDKVLVWVEGAVWWWFGRGGLLFGAGEDEGFLCLGLFDEFEGLNRRGTATDDQDLFAFGISVLTVKLGRVVDWALELLLARDVRCLGITASSNRGDHAVVAALRRVVDDPAALLVLVDFLDARVEASLVLQAVALPQGLDLVDDLLAVGIAFGPLDGGVESIHQAVNLEAAGVVDFGPDAAN